jgi:1,4-dihydroxy-2-naphthoate octaprenyltransferase
VILINEFPDVSADAAVNKRTLVVNLGVPASIQNYRMMLAASYLIAVLALLYRPFVIAGLLYLLTLPIAIVAIKAANKNDLLKPGQYRASQLTVLLHILGSLALTVGFIIFGLLASA